jgi:hypothetical protein
MDLSVLHQNNRAPSMKTNLIRLMIREALQELHESDNKSAAQQAHEMGLVHHGGPYWSKDGKVVAKTVNGKLVQIKAPEEGPSSPEPYGNEPPPLRGSRAERHKADKLVNGYQKKDKASGPTVVTPKNVPSPVYVTSLEEVVGAIQNAESLEARLGKDGAIRKIQDTLNAALSRLKAIERTKHDASKLAQLQKTVRHQVQVLRALRGEPVGQPGSGDPALMAQHKQVTVAGRHGMVDLIDETKGVAYVTWDDGTAGSVAINQIHESSVTSDVGIDESDASDQAKEMGLTYIGFGRYIDDSGDVVAKSIGGKLTRVEHEPVQDSDIDPAMEQKLDKIFNSAGMTFYSPKGLHHPSPGWNANKEMSKKDIPFDANGEKTVEKLLKMVGDPMRLLRWMIKKFKTETPNGKQRMLQYIGILRDMGVLERGGNANQMAQQTNTNPVVTNPEVPETGPKTPNRVHDLLQI